MTYYRLVAINEKTGKKEILTSTPVTLSEAHTMRLKFNPHRLVRIQVEPVEDKRKVKPMAAKKRAKKAKRKTPKKRAKKSKKKAHGEIVASHAVSRAKGFLYFVDGVGNVRRSKMKKGGTRGHRTCR